MEQTESGPKMVSEREAVKREREAYQRGAHEAHHDRLGSADGRRDSGVYVWSMQFGKPILDNDLLRMKSFDRYPLPEIRRPLRGTFSDGTVAWWDAESHFVRRASFPYDCMLSFFASAYVRSDDDHTLLGRMLSGECELVDDDGGDHNS